MARGINTINGIDYVYEYKSYWNAELHRSEQKRDYIGKIRDGVFVPNKIYSMRMELEALKRQNGLPSESDERPLEEELAELIRKHDEHKARLAEKKAAGNCAPSSEADSKIREKASPDDIAEPESAEVEVSPVSEDGGKAVEHEDRHEKHVLRPGELDDEEFGPDLFDVQPSVAPEEDEPEEVVVEEVIDEDEGPDLFAFSDDVEELVSDAEPDEEAPTCTEHDAPVVEDMPEPEKSASVDDCKMKAEPAEPEAANTADEKPKKMRKGRDKAEEDNGQLFLF